MVDTDMDIRSKNWGSKTVLTRLLRVKVRIRPQCAQKPADSKFLPSPDMPPTLPVDTEKLLSRASKIFLAQVRGY